MSMTVQWLMKASRKSAFSEYFNPTDRRRRGKYGETYYTLRSMTLRGQVPPSVNMYWRRFAIQDIPLDDNEKFEVWLRERWYEKDALIEQYVTTGRFPGCKAATNGTGTDGAQGEFIESYVKLRQWYEIGNIFVVLAAAALVANWVARVWNLVRYGKQV